MNFFKTLAMVGLVGVGMVYAEDAPKKAINKVEAINIAQQLLLKKVPTIDIEHRKVKAVFCNDSSVSVDGVKTMGIWKITYTTPDPSFDGRTIYSYDVTLDRWGKQLGVVWFIPSKTP